ncbi:hypothetical protein [Nocardia sp. NPDC051570]|uniref:hypothetical protein n=1 Tax=Nocardia sp. NPDC051570 TaxID=3364324 RepID=UPI003796A5C4
MARDQWETPQQQAIRRKNRIRLAIVGPIALLAVAIAIIAYLRSPEQTGSTSSAAHIPPTFLGEWRGVADNGHDTFDVVLTIRGDSDADVASSSTIDKASGVRCDHTDRVAGATDTELTLSATTATGGPGCDPSAQTTVQLHTDGSLAYRTASPGGTVTGTLRRS